MTDTDLERRLTQRLHREAAQIVPDGEIPALPEPSHRWWQSLHAGGSPRWRAPVLVVAAVLVIGLVTAALVRWLPQDSATPAADRVPVSAIVDHPAPAFDCAGARTLHAARTDAAVIGITAVQFCLTVPLGSQQTGGTGLLASGPLRAILGTESILAGVVDPSVTAAVWTPRTGDTSPATLDLYQLGDLRGFAFPSDGDGTLVLYSGSKVARKDVQPLGPGGALAASSRAASASGPSTTAVISRGGGIVPAEQICVSSAARGVNMPLAMYGDLDSAALRFVGGSPPAALLCGTFTPAVDINNAAQPRPRPATSRICSVRSTRPRPAAAAPTTGSPERSTAPSPRSC